MLFGVPTITVSISLIPNFCKVFKSEASPIMVVINGMFAYLDNSFSSKSIAKIGISWFNNSSITAEPNLPTPIIQILFLLFFLNIKTSLFQ